MRTKEDEEKMQFSARPRPHRLNCRSTRWRQTPRPEVQVEMLEGAERKEKEANLAPVVLSSPAGTERAVELKCRVGEMGANQSELNLPEWPRGYPRRNPPTRTRCRQQIKLATEVDTAISTTSNNCYPSEVNLREKCTQICHLEGQRQQHQTSTTKFTIIQQQDPLRPTECKTNNSSNTSTTTAANTIATTQFNEFKTLRNIPVNLKLLILCHLILPVLLISYIQPIKNQIKSPILLVGAETSEDTNNWQRIPVVGFPELSDSQQARPRAADATYKSTLDRLVRDDIIVVERNQTVPVKPLRKKPLNFIKHNLHHHHKHHHPHLKPHDELPMKSDHAPPTVNHEVEEEEGEKQERTATSNSAGNRKRRHFEGYYGAADRPVVATKKGFVQGITQKLKTGRVVDAFLGIPYAKPPIGSYRFRHPQPMNPWQGQLDASHLPNSCVQVNDTFFGANFLGTSIWNANTPTSEDCLYLNIWTPFSVANTSVPGVTSNKPTRSTNEPFSRSNEQSKLAKRPVLVWIFGGGFYSGTASLALYEGGVLASEEDIIVVSMNYRVSALGFLYFGRPDSPGNSGLFDQLMALQWINDNIDQFGGDPNRVTIFGESAGAVSAALHLLSPLSRNLFSQAILQSGAATCPWGFKESAEIIANGLQLASLINCPANNTDLDAVVECLLRADAMTLVSNSLEVGQTKTILKFPFVPVVDGSFLLESPSESLLKSNFKNARVLLGSNLDEGNSFLIYLPEFSKCPGSGDEDLSRTDPQQQQTNNNNNYDIASTHGDGQSTLTSELRDQSQPIENMDSVPIGRQNLEQFAPILAEAESQRNPNLSDSKSCRPRESLSLSRDDFLKLLREELNPYAVNPVAKESIVYEYSNWITPQDPSSNHDALDKIVGDYYFTCHVNEFAIRYANAGNQVYMYYFKQRSSISPWPKWMGVIHGDEVNFVFGEPLKGQYNYTPKEIQFSKRMMTYWANFAKYGNPTKSSENSSMPENWPEYGDKRHYFELHSDYVRTGRGPRAKQCALWSHYLPKLIKAFDQNQCPSGKNSNLPRPPCIHPLDPSSCPDFGPSRSSVNNPHPILSNVPSAVIISLSVILMLAIIGLLVYAKKTGKRWRNQRAMNQQQRDQQQQQQANQSIGLTTMQTTTTTSGAGSNQATGLDATTSSFGLCSGNQASQAALANSANSLSAGGQPSGSRVSQPPLGAQLQALRPTSVSQSPSAGIRSQHSFGGAATSNSFLDPSLSVGGGSSGEHVLSGEQTALEMAQSAAARVTGSAAAAIAAAKFKMLRSNTLAAAFGRPSSNESQLPGASAGESSSGAPVDLLAMRMKDERIINTLSTAKTRLN